METLNRHGGMPTTCWPDVVAAGSAGCVDSVGVMDRLLRRYQSALLVHLMVKHRLSVPEAEDVLQSFTAEKIIESHLLTVADPARGKFRSFLLRSLDNYCLNALRARLSKQRTPEKGFIPIDQMGAEEPSTSADHPSDSFDVAWAMEVMKKTQEQMQAQCQAENRLDLWEVFASRILRPLLEGGAPLGYEVLVARFGYRSPAQACNTLNTAKRTFIRHLRSVVGDYCLSEKEIDEEIEALKRALSNSRKWMGGT